MSNGQERPFEYNVRPEGDYTGEEWFFNSYGYVTYTKNRERDSELFDLLTGQSSQTSQELNSANDHEKVTRNALRIPSGKKFASGPELLGS